MRLMPPTAATIGPSIRRAEERGPNDPATRPQRVRRAWLISLAMWAVFAVVLAAIIVASS